MAEKWRRRNEFGGHALMGGGTLNIKIISQISGDKGVNDKDGRVDGKSEQW